MVIHFTKIIHFVLCFPYTYIIDTALSEDYSSTTTLPSGRIALKRFKAAAFPLDKHNNRRHRRCRYEVHQAVVH